MRLVSGLVALAALAAVAAPAAAQRTSIPSNDGRAATIMDWETNPNAYDSLGVRRDDPLASGVSALKEKRYRRAAHALGQVVDEHPQNAFAWRLLGVAYAGREDWTASRRAYERVLRLAPDDILSHAGRGQALLAERDPRAAEEAEWLNARIRACGGTCPEAAVLKTLAERGPFAG